jgi:membrane protein DedA with SNARE-associated domain
MEQILALVGSYGYAALFGLLAIGIIGLPIPDETLMVLTGSLVSHGTFTYATAIAVCFSGSLTGMIISYCLGKRLGRPALVRYGRWIRLTPKRLDTTELWFHKYGVWTVAFGYFIPGVRHFTCYLSGISRIRFGRYLMFAGSGALLWCFTFITLGYYVGENWESITDIVHQYVGRGLVAAAIVAGLPAAYILYRKYWSKSKAK